MARRALGRTLVKAGAVASAALTAHALINLKLAPRPQRPPTAIRERVSILLPARNEAHRIEPTIRSLLAQKGLADVEILVLDDGSTDGTGELVERLANGDPRVRLIRGDDNPPPMGWIGKPWACHRLAQRASGSVLAFVDADVTFDPWAIASAVWLLRSRGVDLVSPWPRQLAGSGPERITQPLVNWAWLTLLPVRLVDSHPHPLWSAANGQFLVFDAQAYRSSGGHAAVSGAVIEDFALMRSIKRSGFRATPAIGSDLAECRMYTNFGEIVDGFGKSMWSVFPSSAPAFAALGAATVVFFVPPVAAIAARDPSTRRWGAFGYASVALGRAVIAHRVGERVFPDCLVQPVSLATLFGIVGVSKVRRRRETLTWKGRPVHAAGSRRSTDQSSSSAATLPM